MSAAARSFMNRTFPYPFDNAGLVEMEWAGILGFSADGLPYIGPLLEQTGDESTAAMAMLVMSTRPRLRQGAAAGIGWQMAHRQAAARTVRPRHRE